MNAAHLTSPSLALLTATINSIVVLLCSIQNEVAGVFKSVFAIKGYTTPIRQRVLEVADVTLKNSGDTIDTVVDEQVAGREQEAHVPEWVKFTHECIDSALVGARAKTRTFFFTCNVSYHIEDILSRHLAFPRHDASALRRP